MSVNLSVCLMVCTFVSLSVHFPVLSVCSAASTQGRCVQFIVTPVTDLTDSKNVGGKQRQKQKSTNQQAYYNSNRTNQIYTYVYVVFCCGGFLFICLFVVVVLCTCLFVCLFVCFFVFKKILKQEKLRYKTNNKHHPTHPKKAKPVIRQTSLEKDLDKHKRIL